jgi:hypothetical protein
MKSILSLLSIACFLAASIAAPTLCFGQQLLSGSPQAEGQITEISVRRSGGAFPGSLSEEITAKKEDDGYVLTVSVERFLRRGSRQEKTLPLSQEDWDQLVGIVGDQHLLDWRPERSERSPAGNGASEFEIKGSRQNSQGWLVQITNSAAPDLLFKRMAELASRPAKAQATPVRQFDSSSPPVR